MTQIDHDPKEPSHRALVVGSVVVGILTVSFLLVVRYGLEQFIDMVPIPVLAAFCGTVAGFGAGMWYGWRDCERYHSRTKGKDG